MNYLKSIFLVRQKSSFVLALMVLVPFFFVACSDDPSSLGSELLNQDNIIVSKMDSFTDTLSQKFEPHLAKLSLGSSETLLIGKDANVESQTLLAFYFSVASKYLADLDSNLTFVSADISLTRNYYYGDTLQPFNVGIHQITSSWNSLFTVDSLPKLSYNSSSVVLSQTNTGSVYSFSVDPNLAKDWFKAAKDTSLGQNYGVLLKPNGACRFTGFAASTSYSDVPTIKIVVKKSSAYETYQDTLEYSGSVDVHLIQGTFPEASNKTMTIQSGTGVQGKLWFDLSKLPDDAVVNTAMLVLNVDTLSFKVGSSYIDGLLAYQIVDSVSDSTNSLYVVSLSHTGNTYSGDVARIINNAVVTKNNCGMLIMPSYQIKGIENFAIFNSNPVNGEFKPRLTITYSQKKK